MTAALSIRDLSYRPGTTLPRHHHGPATLSLIIEGEQQESVGRRCYEFPRNSAVLKEGGIGAEAADFITITPWPRRGTIPSTFAPPRS